MFIRGTDARHTILLIDGVRYGSATAGTPIWDNIPVDMIERIEVVKGPASALYGSDGVGGVVQIFMRKGQGGRARVQPARLGHRRQRQLQPRARPASAAPTAAFTYSLDLQKHARQGLLVDQRKGAFRQLQSRPRPLLQDAANLSLGFQLNPDWKVDAGLLYSDGENHFDDGPGRDTWSKQRTETGHIGVRGEILSNWTTRLIAARSTDKSNAVVATPFNLPGLFETIQDQYTWQNDIATPIGTVVAGLESLRQSVNSTTPTGSTAAPSTRRFVGLNGNAGAHSWQLNARRDDNSQFGGVDTWFAGYGYRITPNWRVNGSYGTSFVAPSFNQLYFPGFGNPALQPEEGKNTELGLTWTEGAPQREGGGLRQQDPRLHHQHHLAAEHSARAHQGRDLELRRQLRGARPACQLRLAGPAQRGHGQAAAAPRAEPGEPRHRLHDRRLEAGRDGPVRRQSL